jgi:dipeptidase E
MEQADILLFGGGNASHLLYWIKKSGLEEMLPELLRTRIYVGISAGSIVATKSLTFSSQEKKEIAKKLGEYVGEEALGFVNFHIRPHLNSPQFPSVRLPLIKKKAATIHEPIYAIDDDTAIKVVDDKVEIISEGQWERFN